METIKTIKSRRSIRNYVDKNIDKKIIEDILDSGRLAPSAKNRQPWYFVVLKDKMKNKIADMMIEDKMNSNPILRKKLGYESSSKATAIVIKQAPILILVFREKNDNWIIGDNLSIGACIENMCLRATDLGIGSLWIRDIVYVANDVSKILNHEDMELNCALSLGYTKTIPKIQSRKNLKDIVEWYDENKVL